jgi:hypothetical protein
VKFARKAAVVAAMAFGGLMLIPAAAQASGHHSDPAGVSCSNGGNQYQGGQVGLVNLGNTQVPVNVDLGAAISGIGLLGGLGSGLAGVSNVC